MTGFLFIFSTITILAASAPRTVSAGNKNMPLQMVTLCDPPSKKINREEKWKDFWKDFTDAVYAKDKNRIASLTSKDFFDGGGGTINEWLDMEIFNSDKHFDDFKTTLKKGARIFKNEGPAYKATGKNDSGDLFFEFKNDQWIFGGVVGD